MRVLPCRVLTKLDVFQKKTPLGFGEIPKGESKKCLFFGANLLPAACLFALSMPCLLF